MIVPTLSTINNAIEMLGINVFDKGIHELSLSAMLKTFDYLEALIAFTDSF